MQHWAQLQTRVERVKSLANNTASAALIYWQLLHNQGYEVVRQLIDGLHRRPAEPGAAASDGVCVRPSICYLPRGAVGAL